MQFTSISIATIVHLCPMPRKPRVDCWRGDGGRRSLGREDADAARAQSAAPAPRRTSKMAGDAAGEMPASSVFGQKRLSFGARVELCFELVDVGCVQSASFFRCPKAARRPARGGPPRFPLSHHGGPRGVCQHPRKRQQGEVPKGKEKATW